jgi:hypothetical protein
LACEIAEEYSSVAKRYLKRSIVGLSISYILLAIDGLPFTKCMIGLVANISYFPLLKTFPFVDTISLATIWASIITITNHMVWFNYFVSDEYRRTMRREDYEKLGSGSPAMRVMGFLFIFVWLVPLGFFISLTSMEENLPYANLGGKKRKGIFRGLIYSIFPRRSKSV